MKLETHQKVTAEHLKRAAYLYIRQSSSRQVVDNQESTKRQYALKERAVALGWPAQSIIVIDEDLGQSGACGQRSGFQRLVAEVGMGHAGIVMGLEVSRLARNSVDWHRLLEICALTRTLILDEDGVYDPAHFNDRLLLGLKGTMSEVELHMLRARLTGGMLNKASRGELKKRLPIGFVYDAHDRIVLDPDKQIQETIRLFFRTFRRAGTVYATVRTFREQGLTFPKRMHYGPQKGQIVWPELTVNRASQTLHNPHYAGAYSYGRRKVGGRWPDGRARLKGLPQDEWHTLIKDAHEGYITWPQYEENVKRIEGNRLGPHKCPPREGPALLQGLVVCGVCGRKMSVRYHHRNEQLIPEYVCAGEGGRRAMPKCQSIPGGGIDKAVGKLLVEAMSPVAFAVALAVQQELQARIEEADRVRLKQVDRVRYEAELAQRRYMKVDPDNRLVADELEAAWNRELKRLRQTEEEYQHRREADRKILDEETQQRVMSLATDFPRLWKDPRTPQRERKRMVRLLVEDVTLIKGEEITLHVRYKGGATKTINVSRPLPRWQVYKTDEKVLAEIDRLLSTHTLGQIANELNRRGFVSAYGRSFDCNRVLQLRKAYGMKSRFDRMRETGLLTAKELANRFGVRTETIRKWRTQGRLNGHRVDDMGRHLFDDPGPIAPPKGTYNVGSAREVQYE